MKIDAFRGKYYFLSNFCPAFVTYDGIMYLSAEAAYQAQKTLDIEKRKEISFMPAGEAKMAGKKLELRPDWEEEKVHIMYEICKTKFTENRDHKHSLLLTGWADLEEGNSWGDTYWGTVNGKGENRLGRILMRIRDEIK